MPDNTTTSMILKQDGQSSQRIILLILLLLLPLAFFIGMQYQRIKSSGSQSEVMPKRDEDLQKREVDIYKLFTFELPEGWLVRYTGRGDYVSIVSRDIKENPVPTLERGAEIIITRKSIDKSGVLEQHILSSIPEAVRESYGRIKSIQMGDKTYLNNFYCWEDCHDAYYLQRGDEVWIISLQAEPIFSTKEAIDRTKYARDRDFILKTFTFIK